MTPLLLSALLAVAPGAPDKGIVVAKGKNFIAAVASTPAEQMHGLMECPYLPQNECMFFIYPSDGQHPIWMKNCLISLDVVWVKADGTVVETSENVPPCSPILGDNCPTYGGKVPARDFVEFPAGTLRRIGLKKFDRIGWELPLPDGSRVTGGVPVAKLKASR